VEYLNQLGDKKVFTTTLDERIARLYPISAWRVNEKVFQESTEDPETLEDLQDLANHYGEESVPDSHGRILLSQNLRKLMGLENQTVFLSFSQMHFKVSLESEYMQRFASARLNADQKAKRGRELGLK
jgi:DNA-binding transcriptional regulator/RsmH inhibitor MraZ